MKIIELKSDWDMGRIAKVIAGFPGIGKSHYQKNHKGMIILDSDSTDFSWSDEEKTERNPDFPNNYIEHIKSNLGKVDIILVSTHDEVRKALEDNNIDYTLVYPEQELEREYMIRYHLRGSDEKFMDFISARWDEMIENMQKETFPKHIVLKSDEYLSDRI